MSVPDAEAKRLSTCSERPVSAPRRYSNAEQNYNTADAANVRLVRRADATDLRRQLPEEPISRHSQIGYQSQAGHLHLRTLPGWVADNCSTRRHIARYDGARADNGIIAHIDARQKQGTSPNPNIGTYGDGQSGFDTSPA